MVVVCDVEHAPLPGASENDLRPLGAALSSDGDGLALRPIGLVYIIDADHTRPHVQHTLIALGFCNENNLSSVLSVDWDAGVLIL